MRWVWLVVVVAFALGACGGSPKPEPRAAAADAEPTPAPRTDVAAIAARAHVPVLCYHQIRPQTSADSAQDRAVHRRPGGPRGADARAGQGRATRRSPATRSSPTRARRAAAAQAGAADLRRRLGRAVHARAADPAPAPLRRDVLHHDGRAGQARVAHPRAGARARPRGDDDRRAHVGPQGRHDLHGRRLGHRDHRAHARPRAAGRPPGAAVRLPVRPLESRRVPAPAPRALHRRVPAGRQARPPRSAVDAAADHRARAHGKELLREIKQDF